MADPKATVLGVHDAEGAPAAPATAMKQPHKDRPSKSGVTFNTDAEEREIEGRKNDGQNAPRDARRKPSGPTRESSEGTVGRRDGRAPTYVSTSERLNRQEHGGSMHEDVWYEYEHVLTRVEKVLVDRVDNIARKICPFKCMEASSSDQRSCLCIKRYRRSTTDNNLGNTPTWRLRCFGCCGGRRRDGPLPYANSSSTVGDSKSDTSGQLERPSSRTLSRKGRRRLSWWEGIRPDFPERYQRWEGIRERNPIMSLLFSLSNHGQVCRMQPSRVERVHLFLLYAAVWLFSYSTVLGHRGDQCRMAWAERCVPRNVTGGGCADRCASDAILDATPQEFRDYERFSLKIDFNIDAAVCLKAGSIRSPCEIPMCTRNLDDDCMDEDETAGFCKCKAVVEVLVWEYILYAVLHKILYLPFWFVLRLDVEDRHRHFNCIILTVVVLMYSMLFLLGLIFMWRLLGGSFTGFAIAFLFWIVSFVLLCCLEVVKAFTLGYIVASYLIRPLCPILSKLWKFAFA
mmetsp:Transcript_4047/g.11504  ORF Transcript_4047/g.11504 Transcript_4047/m.11504 type:complete len:514 (+) Transcript_4047:75-1616(+)